MDKIIEFFHEAQPIIAFVGTLLSITVLGFIIKLTQLSKSARSDQIRAIEEQKKTIEQQKKIIEEQKTAVVEQKKIIEEQKTAVEERLKNSEADLARTKKWHEKEKGELQAKLSGLMDSENISLEKLFENSFLSNLQNEIKNKIDSVLLKIHEFEDSTQLKQSNQSDDPQWYIEIAKGYTATNRWRQAAEYYGKYLGIKQSDWEVHFYQGVAYQNAREGKETDFLASVAFSSAILWIPENVDRNFKSRIYTYKGATLKRLNRLDESEAYLILGEKYATEEYEVYDNKYNLACIYSMKSKRKELFEKLLELSEKPRYLHSVKAHLNDYFANYANDPDFLEMVR